MLKISMTYETITPESAEYGDVSERGFVFEACDCTARELANYITREGFTEPSDSRGVPRWLTAHGESDYHAGDDAQSQRVWSRVLCIAGIVKG